MKKVVLAIDAFKNSLSSQEAENAAKEGIKEVWPACQVDCVPVADGGEGILEVLVEAVKGEYVYLEAHDPLMRPVLTRYGMTRDRKKAVIEMATVCGLPLLSPVERNPMEATSYGLGELIRDALEKGVREFIIGIGGSATNDAGLGMLQALGFCFRDKAGKILGKGGQVMEEVAVIDDTAVHPALKEACFTVACDVDNPFCGENGAVFVYGPQKGADKSMMGRLDKGMASLAEVIAGYTGKNIVNEPGAGAAGGMGGCFLAFFRALLKPGIRLVLELSDFNNRIAGADMIITGEGHADRQTLRGKVPYGVLEEARKQRIPVLLIAGGVEDTCLLNEAGFQGVFSILPGPFTLEESMEADFAKRNIKVLLRQICRLVEMQGE